MCRINPRVDFAFKKLFGSEENKDILIDLINSIVSEQDMVIDLTLKNPYNPKDFGNDKLSILDIKAQDTKGKWFNIEMQIVNQEYFAQRALYYWARLYTGQLSSGVNYDTLKKTIGINILNFNCLDEEAYHNVYKLKNVENGNEFLGHQEIHFIELGKYDEKLSTLLDRWVNFLKKADNYERGKLPPELGDIPTIQKALEVLESMNFSEHERDVYEARLKWLRDEQMAILTAEKRGREEGRQEGREKGRQEGRQEGIEEGRQEAVRIVASLLKGDSMETISKVLGVSLERISEIKKQLGLI